MCLVCIELYAFTIWIHYRHLLYAFTICIPYMHSLFAFTICIHYMHLLHAYTICIHYMHILNSLYLPYPLYPLDSVHSIRSPFEPLESQGPSVTFVLLEIHTLKCSKLNCYLNTFIPVEFCLFFVFYFLVLQWRLNLPQTSWAPYSDFITALFQ